MNKKILTCLFCFFLACFLVNSLQAKKVVRILINQDSKFQGDWNSVLEEQLKSHKKIRVTNTSTTTNLNEFQVKFTFNPSSDPDFFQHCGTNGENLGIWTKGGTKKLPSWVENWSSSSATVWFKVHSIPTGGSKIYRFYCDPSKKGDNDPNKVFYLYENFEDGNLNGWSFNGNRGWTITSTRHSGLYGATNMIITHRQFSGIYRSVSIPSASIITFYWNVSAEKCCDHLHFYLDNIQIFITRPRPNDNLGWQFRQYSLNPGTHTIEWRYTKDGSVSRGTDRGFIDDIIIRAKIDSEPVVSFE